LIVDLIYLVDDLMMVDFTCYLNPSHHPSHLTNQSHFHLFLKIRLEDGGDGKSGNWKIEDPIEVKKKKRKRKRDRYELFILIYFG